jgi:hypothetical protein
MFHPTITTIAVEIPVATLTTTPPTMTKITTHLQINLVKVQVQIITLTPMTILPTLVVNPLLVMM